MATYRIISGLWLLVGMLFAANGSLAAPLNPPPAPEVSAESYILQDAHSGRVLAQANADQRVEPASLTKMMTAYVVFAELAEGNISLDDTVPISEKAWRTPGSRTFVEVGTKVSLETLLKGMIIQSGNDASVALAEYIGGSEEVFAQLMNQQAENLGMTDTHFVNSTGLPASEHYTTARDMATLARALARDFPEHYSWHAIKEYTYNGIHQNNRNSLLWRDPHVDGVKTGHTEAAGYCLVASAQREGMRLVSAVMGTDSPNSRAQQSLKLLNYGFRFYETHRLYQASEEISSVRVWKGAQKQLPVGIQKDLYVTIPRGHYDSLNAEMTADQKVMAPVTSGQQLGTVNVTLAGETLMQRAAIALADVGEGTWYQQISDAVLLWFE